MVPTEWPTIVVVVEKPGTEALPGELDPCLCRYIGKGPVMIIVVKKIVAADIGDEEIRIAIVVVVGGHHSFGKLRAVDAGSQRNVLERAIAAIVVHLAGTLLVGDEEIEPAVVVDVGPGRGLRSKHVSAQAGFPRDIGKCAVAVVTQQRKRHRHLPPSPQDQNVHASVIVVIGLDHVGAAGDFGQARRFTAVGKCAIPIVVEIQQVAAHVVTRRHHVEEPAILKIFDNHSARQLE